MDNVVVGKYLEETNGTTKGSDSASNGSLKRVSKGKVRHVDFILVEVEARVIGSCYLCNHVSMGEEYSLGVSCGS